MQYHALQWNRNTLQYKPRELSGMQWKEIPKFSHHHETSWLSGIHGLLNDAYLHGGEETGVHLDKTTAGSREKISIAGRRLQTFGGKSFKVKVHQKSQRCENIHNVLGFGFASVAHLGS